MPIFPYEYWPPLETGAFLIIPVDYFVYTPPFKRFARFDRYGNASVSLPNTTRSGCMLAFLKSVSKY